MLHNHPQIVGTNSRLPALPYSYWQGTSWGWYDISDFTSLYTDTGKTTQATSTGDNISVIEDKSGNGFDMVISSGTACELKQSGGYYYLNFTGSEHYACDWNNGTEVLTGKNDISVWGAFRKGTGGDGPAYGSNTASLTNIDVCDFEASDDVRWRIPMTGTNISADQTDAAFDGDDYYGGIIYDSTFTAYTNKVLGFANGSQITSGITNPSGTTWNDNFRIQIGRFNSTNYWAGGRFYGGIMGTGMLTDATDTAEVLDFVNKNNAYLASLQGLSYTNLTSLT